MIDATLIFQREKGSLYQGGAPALGKAVALRRAGFHVIVLCAREVQPMGFEDVGIHVLRVPLDDVVNPTTSDLRRAAGAAKEVAKLVRSGRRVLVTCAMGLNRSGLVNALALRELTGASGVHCSAHVQNKRKGALSNPTFQRLLESLAAKNVQ